MGLCNVSALEETQDVHGNSCCQVPHPYTRSHLMLTTVLQDKNYFLFAIWGN